MRLIVFFVGLAMTMQASAQVRIQNATASARFEAGSDLRIAEEQRSATWSAASISYSHPQPPYFFGGGGYAVVGFGLDNFLSLESGSEVGQRPGAPATRTFNRGTAEIVIDEPTSTWLVSSAGSGTITTAASSATRFELVPHSESAMIEGLPPEARGKIVFPGPFPNPGEMCVTLHPGVYLVKLENETYQPEHRQQFSSLRVSTPHTYLDFAPISAELRSPSPREVCSGGFLVFDPSWRRATDVEWQVEDQRVAGGWVNITGRSHRLENGLGVSADGQILPLWSEVAFRDYSNTGGQTARVRVRAFNGCGEETFSQPVTVTVHTCCRADIDWSTQVDATDIFVFLDAWFARLGPGAYNDPIDWDHSGTIDATDVFQFLDSWFAERGC